MKNLKHKDTILLMVSGGIDSTGMIFKILNDVKYENWNVWLHHIVFDNIDNRHEAETISINNIFRYLVDNGFKFKLTSNTIDYQFMNDTPNVYDNHWYATTASLICNGNNDIKEVGIAFTPEGMKQKHVRWRYLRIKKIFNANLWHRYSKAKIVWPVITISKVEMYKSIPDELKPFLWSCRKPKKVKDEFIPCRKCKTCVEMLQMGLPLIERM